MSIAENYAQLVVGVMGITVAQKPFWWSAGEQLLPPIMLFYYCTLVTTILCIAHTLLPLACCPL